ncbi:MAG: BrnT family toxin [Deltaproteobacteria bacterium]|nr:BrnT family toxin [Deltaproteobacteria bacterium]
MRFEWDEAKRRSNMVKHGIDFLDIDQVFDGKAFLTIG